MPQQIAEIEHPPPVVTTQHLVVFVQIGDVGELDAQAPLFRLDDVAADRRLDLAEIAAERNLLIVGDVLVVKHQHGVAVHAGLDGGDIRGRQRSGQVDA